ncbi:RNA polymerase sigma factor [Nocardioides panzhihuensis]|uniref:RNA polymerase sigma-70 factor (ECF subfamily) n=1 Tax=Nocardioides panzhihuensis TaxID=860243 RepID=A0A7Z0IQM4_9ACTN|nr:sigma-70 family RNA polymerase sigma factor [Nocardioides panzhihuensis]NYI75817.1 RNA polymerase sigma-70 factor (ECF subfamily) [Nocardioides panzhihuensis]
MSLMHRATSEIGAAPDEAWANELNDPGPPGHAAQRSLHDLLLRATRHQVWRLRHQLPGAGPADLEDLAQQAADDALVAVLGKLDTFEGRSRFSTWVYKFGLLHAGVAVRRQSWRHREVALPDTFDVSDGGVTPEAFAQGSELSRAVHAAISTDLTPHQRRVTLALLVEQVPIDVLAERLNTNRNALYKTLHDARQRLRACLMASGHLDDPSLRSTP